MADPLVSVSIPSYNHARWLPRAIESVLAQTYPSIELIVVDDGSSDGSLAIARSYEAAHPDTIRVLTHPGGRNLGISATVNRGCQQARGSYWGGLPSDDELCPHKVECQVERLEADPELVFVYGYSEPIDSDGRRLPGHGLLGGEIGVSPRPIERLLRSNIVPGLTGLVRVSAMRTPPPVVHQERLVYSDWDFWIRLAARGRVGLVARPLARSRIHDYNTSFGSEPRVDQLRHLAVLERVSADADQIDGLLAVPATRAVLELELALRHHALGNLAAAAARLSSAFTADPSLEHDPDRLWAWLLAVSDPATPPCSRRGHTAALRWIESGGGGAPTPAATPEANFPIWAYAQLRPRTRALLAQRLAFLQIAQAAYAAEREGDLRTARALALRCAIKAPGNLRQPAFQHLLARLALGRTLTAGIRAWRGARQPFVS